jgi:hypothetical protein
LYIPSAVSVFRGHNAASALPTTATFQPSAKLAARSELESESKLSRRSSNAFTGNLAHRTSLSEAIPHKNGTLLLMRRKRDAM